MTARKREEIKFVFIFYASFFCYQTSSKFIIYMLYNYVILWYTFDKVSNLEYS